MIGYGGHLVIIKCFSHVISQQQCYDGKMKELWLHVFNSVFNSSLDTSRESGLRLRKPEFLVNTTELPRVAEQPFTHKVILSPPRFELTT